MGKNKSKMMHALIQLLILLIVIMFGISACTKKPVSELDSIVMSYLTTTDEKKLLQYLDKHSQKKIEAVRKQHTTVYPVIWFYHDTNAQWQVVEVTKSHNRAKVIMQCVKHPKQNAVGLTVIHTLINEDGKWKISLQEELRTL